MITLAVPDRRRELISNIAMIVVIFAIIYAGRHLRWEVVWGARKLLLRGLLLSWELAVISVVLGMIAAIPLAVSRLYGFWVLRYLATAYIEIVRAIPPLMVIFWVFFTIPAMSGHAIAPFFAAVASLFLMSSAYLAEVVRSGLVSVPAAQIEGGLSTGLSRAQTFIFIVLPQALRNMIPAIIAQVISLFKTTSLVYVVGLVEFFRAVLIVNNRVFAPYELYATAAAVYFVCCYSLSWLIRKLDPEYRLVE